MAEGQVGANVKRLRVEHGLTQGELGEKLGIDRKHVSKIETGIIGPGKPLMHKLCEVFAVDELTLRFGERKEEQPQTPEHLKLLFEMISEVFPDSMSLIQKNDILTKVLQDLREAKKG